LYTTSGNVNWCNHCGKQHRGSSKKLKIEPPYDPVIPPSGIYMKEKNTNLKISASPCSRQHHLK